MADPTPTLTDADLASLDSALPFPVTLREWTALRKVVARIKADAEAAARADERLLALTEARDEIKAMLDSFKQRGRHTRARWAVEWLGHIINRHEATQADSEAAP